ncbi:sensor histidine kinase [Patescibacteria group bacterium]
MFKEARVKLTFWYVFIIMVVSLSFSGVIYRGSTTEFERRLDTIERRLQLRRFGLLPQGGQEQFFIQDLVETRNQIFTILLYTNAGILALSSFAGYFLAGKTLSPIEETLVKQKRFVADASHELRTPITSLQTSIEVSLRDKKLNLRLAKSTLRSALVDIEGLRNLTDNLLTLARTNGGSVIRELVEVSDITSEISKRFLPIAKKKKVKFITKTKKVSINTNRADLVKLLSILIDNAIKYTPGGGVVKLSVRTSRRSVRFVVSDTGVGIHDEDKRKIFDRFYRVDASRTKKRVQGYGLGLAIAKDILKRNNGKISLKSQNGKGTAFTVTLPR